MSVTKSNQADQSSGLPAYAGEQRPPAYQPSERSDSSSGSSYFTDEKRQDAKTASDSKSKGLLQALGFKSTPKSQGSGTSGKPSSSTSPKDDNSNKHYTQAASAYLSLR